ncbi:MAG: TRAP transporter small permease subunit [Alphaproteobacteria bacterium]|nr:TRAP transporter small permease subunit [Alphaproteobacteria bacterium]
MQALCRSIDSLNENLGRIVAWLALFMVIGQFALVLLRYVFGLNFIAAQEGMLYMHGTLFLLAAGYTLLHNGHVRVDLLYRAADARTRAQVNLLGVIFFLLPMCALIWWAAWPFVAVSWQTLEGSIESSGLPFKYLYKSVILLFTALLALQGISQAIKAVLVLKGKAIPEEDEAPSL